MTKLNEIYDHQNIYRITHDKTYIVYISDQFYSNHSMLYQAVLLSITHICCSVLSKTSSSYASHIEQIHIHQNLYFDIYLEIA